jgi:glucosamine--fructose-6-phosphate aminotransferase (isomerizing)
MCGIVGYIGDQEVTPALLDGLRRLEYRGYDSAGIAVVGPKGMELRRAQGKLQALEDALQSKPINEGLFGLGHTRWATHGRPSEENAHPHRDCSGRLVVVHNGIIENYVELKNHLSESGHRFATETDTEIVAHLIEEELRRNGVGLADAVRTVLPRLRGIYALAILHQDHPEVLVGARQGPPLVVGLGQDEFFLASDIPAILSHTRDMIFLDDGDVAVVTRQGVRITDHAGAERQLPVRHITWDPIQAEKGGYRHFMLKEIHEQPHTVRETLVGRISRERGTVDLDPMDISEAELASVRHVQLVACGTSWHACLVGKYLIENVAGLPVEVDYGSEFRYRSPILPEGTLHLVVTQSGETADTLAALRWAKESGALTMSICNVVDSMATREARGTIYTHCGPEIGVASTKAFTAQIVCLYLLALKLGGLRKTLTLEETRRHLDDLVHLPALMEEVLRQDHAIEPLARSLSGARDFLYLGRGINYPIALEGALKLKEISYIHAEGYPAGEMKHGPIALIDQSMPVVALCPRDLVYEKMLGNVEEVKARGGLVLAVVTAGEGAEVVEKADHVIAIPPSGNLVTPILLSLPLQLLAYHIARILGCDVDQPRNLAKSVTVE